MKACLFILPLSLTLMALLVKVASGSAVRTVIYRDGQTDDMFSSLEDIPPRREWFRVRPRQQPRQQIVQQQQRTQYTRYPEQQQHRPRHVMVDEPEVIPLEPRSPKQAPSGIRTREQNRAFVPEKAPTTSLHVQISSRGRVGLQSNRGMKDSRGNQDDRVFSRGDWEENFDTPPLSRLPFSTGQEQNWHLNIRHENGGHRGRVDSRGRQDVNEHNREQTIPEEDIMQELNHSPKNSMSLQDNDNFAAQTTSHDDSIDETELERVAARPHVLVTQTAGQDQKRIVRIREPNSVDENSEIDPPPHELYAKMARYIVHYSNWTSVATISTRSPVQGYPFANIFSVSDGPNNNSSGTPYLYLTPLDMSVTDLKNDSRASLTMSLAQSGYCAAQHYDPEDPRCAHVILSGKIVQVTSSDESNFARTALFSTHPEMPDWPKDHGWFFAKLQIENILVLDYFGGAKTVMVNDYYRQTLL